MTELGKQTGTAEQVKHLILQTLWFKDSYGFICVWRKRRKIILCRAQALVGNQYAQMPKYQTLSLHVSDLTLLNIGSKLELGK